MKRILFSKYNLLALSSLFMMSAPYAGIPVWTFTPLTPTTVAVSPGSTATVRYQITNQSKKTHILQMKPIPGVTQVTGAGSCPNPFVLDGNTSCNLTLVVNGSQISTGSTNGPVVCEAGNSLQCYRPSPTALLTFTTATASKYSVGGDITGLTSQVQLQNNGADTQTYSSNGPFTFPTTLDNGSPYNVTVSTQPVNEFCFVTNGSGTISGADITNVFVNCSSTIFSVGGSISGLSGTVILQNNGSDALPRSSNGAFTFSTPVPNGNNYNVTVQTQPATQFCSVSNGSGVINSANVTNVLVTCSTNAYTVGGTVSGLTGTVTLLNNGANSTPISSNGAYSFSTPVAQGSPYSVTIDSQPAGQTCVVSNGSGTMGSSNVTNVNVSCTTDTFTLTTSPTNLALETNGIARTITVTNTGSSTAQNLSINYPTWPTGTTANSTCGSSLNAGNTCTITVTPGANATANCTTGTAATPGVITVSADNVSSPPTTNAVVLGYMCIYQQGYVFAIDDTTPSTSSAGGTVLALSDNSASHIWANNGITSAQSRDDGATNTATIVADGAVGSSSAALICTNYTVDSSGNSPCSVGTCYNNWYQPAICQMGGASDGASCTPGIQNIGENLPNLINSCTGPQCLALTYWSSSESSLASTTEAFMQQFLTGSNAQFTIAKATTASLRCTRDFS